MKHSAQGWEDEVLDPCWLLFSLSRVLLVFVVVSAPAGVLSCPGA